MGWLKRKPEIAEIIAFRHLSPRCCDSMKETQHPNDRWFQNQEYNTETSKNLQSKSTVCTNKLRWRLQT